MRFASVLMTAATQGGGWSPAALGSSLLAWWDAERTDLITQSSGAVSSWRDIVGGYDAVQATGAAQPMFSATSFNGRPGVTFDATDDELTCTDSALLSQLGGATAYEMWALVDQQALPADATTRVLMSVGGNTGGSNRNLQRIVSGGVNRARFIVGVTTALPSGDYSGRHVFRGRADGADIQAYLDGVASSTAAVVPTTAADRVRIGATPLSAAGSFWNGVVPALLITTALSAGNAAQLQAYLSRRV